MALQEQLKREGDYLFKYRGYLPLIFLVFALAVRGLYMHYGSNNSAVISSISAFMQSIALYWLIWSSGSIVHRWFYTQKHFRQKHQ